MSQLQSHLYNTRIITYPYCIHRVIHWIHPADWPVFPLSPHHCLQPAGISGGNHKLASTVIVSLKPRVNAPFSSFKQTNGLRGSCKCLDKHQNVPLLYRHIRQQSLAASLFPSAAFRSAVRKHSYVRALASINNLYKQKFQQRLLLARVLGKSFPCRIIMQFIDHVHVCTYKEFCELLSRL